MRIEPKFRMTGWVLAAGAVGLIAAPAIARHSWKDYHWARATIVSVPVVDNTNGNHVTDWPARVNRAVGDWNVSDVISSALDTTGGNPSCNFMPNEINVCNDYYGSNGWLGIAVIEIDPDDHITAGIVKLNDSYFASGTYATYSYRQQVACQELGHTYGLTHQNESFFTDKTTSCMEYTMWPEGNEQPDQHDKDQLAKIYSHDDTASGGGGGGGNKGGGGGGPGGGGGGKGRPLGIGNSPADWGAPVDFLPNGKPFVFEKQVDDIRIITHVTWVPDRTAADHIRRF